MTIPKLKPAVITAIAVAVVLAMVIQHHREKSRLRTENEFLRKRVEELSPFATEIERLNKLITDGASLEATNQADTASELMRLRSEVGQLRRENPADKAAAASRTFAPPHTSELAVELARHKLRFAEEILRETEALFKAGLASAADHDKTRLAQEIAEAEFRQDGDRLRQLRTERAQKVLAEAEEQYNSGQITAEEYNRAQLERDVAVAELNNDPFEVAHLKLKAAESNMELVEARQNIGKATRIEFLRAKLDRDIAASEFAQHNK